MPEIDGLREHAGDDHARHNLDGDCPECGTDHRVIASLPNQPISPEKFEEIETADSVLLARPIVSIPGHIVGSDADKVSEDALLATEKTVRTLTRYQEEGGWVVKQELAVPDDNTPMTFALEVYDELVAEFDHIEEGDIDQGDLIQ